MLFSNYRMKKNVIVYIFKKSKREFNDFRYYFFMLKFE